MLKNKKKAIDHVLKTLGYQRWLYDGEYSTPDIDVREAIYAVCNHLNIKIVRQLGVIAVKKSSNRAKKEKK